MEELLKNIKTWVEMKIDALAAGNPQMAIFAPRIKKGIYNLIKQNIGKIEPIMPFLTDEDGNIDIGDMRSEVIDIFEGMPSGEYQMGAFRIVTDKASVKIEVPDGVLWQILLGDIKSVKFGTKDVEDLIDLFQK
ncbi:MAG: hypothetical protein J6R25_00775 [Bacteroidales bacterium]|nr:hypothetical protein [Bacteroidales bacterium]